MDVIANKEFMKCIRYVCPQKTVTATGASTAPTPTPHPGTALLGVCHDGGCLLARLSCHSCLAFVCLSGKGLPYEPHKLPKNYHMTQQSHCWAYTPRKPKLKETQAPQSSLQHLFFFSFNNGWTWKQPRCPLTDEHHRNCGAYIQWNGTQFLKRTHLSQS